MHMQKAGTTSLANHLKQHPALSGMDGLPWHESLSKETHFFNGVLGRSHASSALLYRSFFPTILCRWWSEYIRGVGKVILKSLMLVAQGCRSKQYIDTVFLQLVLHLHCVYQC